MSPGRCDFCAAALAVDDLFGGPGGLEVRVTLSLEATGDRRTATTRRACSYECALAHVEPVGTNDWRYARSSAEDDEKAVDKLIGMLHRAGFWNGEGVVESVAALLGVPRVADARQTREPHERSRENVIALRSVPKEGVEPTAARHLEKPAARCASRGVESQEGRGRRSRQGHASSENADRAPSVAHRGKCPAAPHQEAA
jgi:hypothetical protein